MFFFFSWALPLVALVISIHYLFRDRALQHVGEVGVAAWLLIVALDGVVRFTA
jgi:hypothetical protein